MEDPAHSQAQLAASKRDDIGDYTTCGGGLWFVVVESSRHIGRGILGRLDQR